MASLWKWCITSDSFERFRRFYKDDHNLSKSTYTTTNSWNKYQQLKFKGGLSGSRPVNISTPPSVTKNVCSN